MQKKPNRNFEKVEKRRFNGGQEQGLQDVLRSGCQESLGKGRHHTKDFRKGHG